MTQILSIDVGIKNLSYCYIDVKDDKSIVINNWNNLTLTEENVKKLKLEEISDLVLTNLIQHFDDNFYADVVLIENQPMLKNGLMKTIAVIIYTYFNMMKIQFGNIQQVKFISATNKLKHCDKLSLSTYKDRKKLSIEIAKNYLQQYQNQYLEWFESQTKKDDCADCLNQAIYYINTLKK